MPQLISMKMVKSSKKSSFKCFVFKIKNKQKVVPKINPSRVEWIGPFIPASTLPAKKVVHDLADGKSVVIANVRNGTHFVLVTGFDAKTISDGAKGKFYVNDPGFNENTYPFEGIVGWRVFQMY